MGGQSVEAALFSPDLALLTSRTVSHMMLESLLYVRSRFFLRCTAIYALTTDLVQVLLQRMWGGSRLDFPGGTIKCGIVNAILPVVYAIVENVTQISSKNPQNLKSITALSLWIYPG